MFLLVTLLAHASNYPSLPRSHHSLMRSKVYPAHFSHFINIAAVFKLVRKALNKCLMHALYKSNNDMVEIWELLLEILDCVKNLD